MVQVQMEFGGEFLERLLFVSADGQLKSVDVHRVNNGPVTKQNQGDIAQKTNTCI